MEKSPVHSISIFFISIKKYSAILIISLILLPACDYFFPPLNGDNVSAEDAYKFLENHKNDPDIVILDIRTKKEYDSLRIENAINLDFSRTDFPEMTEKLDKNKRYIIIDRNGKHSAMAFELFREEKFNKVHYISGGLNEWTGKNLPVKKH